MRFIPKSLALTIAVLGASAAQASLINFDDQGLTGPSIFSSASPSPQTITRVIDGITVTFTGGVILTNTLSLPANQTSIYGTADFGSGLSNPLTVTFSAPVQNIVFDVLNGQTTTETFEVADNLGNAQSFSLAPNLSSGATTIGLASLASSFTVRQGALGATSWDFFIDNIQFNVGINCGRTGCTTALPEPGSIALVGLALLGVAAARRRRAA